MTKELIQKELLHFICENFLVAEQEVVFDQSLVEQGIIDSFGLVEIAAFIKKTYGFATPNSEMTLKNFGSVEKITAYILGKVHGGA